MMNQSRLKSPILWSAIIAQVLAILVAVGIIDVGESDIVNTVVGAILQVLILLGVLNNPTKPECF